MEPGMEMLAVVLAERKDTLQRKDTLARELSTATAALAALSPTSDSQPRTPSKPAGASTCSIEVPRRSTRGADLAISILGDFSSGGNSFDEPLFSPGAGAAAGNHGPFGSISGGGGGDSLSGGGGYISLWANTGSRGRHSLDSSLRTHSQQPLLHQQAAAALHWQPPGSPGPHTQHSPASPFQLPHAQHSVSNSQYPSNPFLYQRCQSYPGGAGQPGPPSSTKDASFFPASGPTAPDLSPRARQGHVSMIGSSGAVADSLWPGAPPAPPTSQDGGLPPVSPRVSRRLSSSGSMNAALSAALWPESLSGSLLDSGSLQPPPSPAAHMKGVVGSSLWPDAPPAQSGPPEAPTSPMLHQASLLASHSLLEETISEESFGDE